jgi:hypothetical protein
VTQAPPSAQAQTYDTELGRITRSTTHEYTFEGKTYPGVTSILKVIDKSDALMSWAARNTAEAAISQIGNLPSLLENVGPEGVVKALTARSAWKRDEAAQLGTLVHSLADDVINGRPGIIPPNAVDHVRHYVEWWEASGWTLRTSEAYLIQPDHGYGGTLDLLCRDRDGRTVLADIKTGKGVYSEAVLQLTAYGDAMFIQPPGGGVHIMPKVDRYAILHVTADGVREIEVPVGTLERLAWGGVQDLYAWHRTVKGKRL